MKHLFEGESLQMLDLGKRKSVTDVYYSPGADSQAQISEGATILKNNETALKVHFENLIKAYIAI